MKILTNLPKIDEAVQDMEIQNSICMETEGGLILFSGFAGIDLATGKISEGPFSKHANDSLDCYELILGSLGLSLDNVLKVNCFLQNPTVDFPEWNTIFKSRFKRPYPCRTSVGSPLIVGLIELEITASRTSRLDAEVIAA